MEHLRFEDMQLSKEIYQGVLDMGFEERHTPHPVPEGNSSGKSRQRHHRSVSDRYRQKQPHSAFPRPERISIPDCTAVCRH